MNVKKVLNFWKHKQILSFLLGEFKNERQCRKAVTKKIDSKKAAGALATIILHPIDKEKRQ